MPAAVQRQANLLHGGEAGHRVHIAVHAGEGDAAGCNQVQQRFGAAPGVRQEIEQKALFLADALSHADEGGRGAPGAAVMTFVQVDVHVGEGRQRQPAACVASRPAVVRREVEAHFGDAAVGDQQMGAAGGGGDDLAGGVAFEAVFQQ